MKVPCHSAEFFYERHSSRFWSYLYPLENNGEQLKTHLAELGEIHPRASHIVYAYRLGTRPLYASCSDDGEPRGTAGKPILFFLEKQELTDLCVLVVRYFGGTLLGRGGLVSAYTSSAQGVVQKTLFKEKEDIHHYRLVLSFSFYEKIKGWFLKDKILYSESHGLFVECEIGVYRQNEEAFLEFLRKNQINNFYFLGTR